MMEKLRHKPGEPTTEPIENESEICTKQSLQSDEYHLQENVYFESIPTSPHYQKHLPQSPRREGKLK